MIRTGGQPPRRPRVVFVGNSLRVGGSQAVTLELVRAAIDAGFEAVVASRGGEMAPVFAAAGALTVTLIIREGVAAEEAARITSMAKTAVSSAAVVQLAGLCARQRTLLHASQPWPVAIASYAARLTRTPLVWHAHGTTDVEMPASRMGSVRTASKAWVGITPEVRRALGALNPASHTRVLAIPSPVRRPSTTERASAKCQDGRLVIGVMSTLTTNKRRYVECCLMAARELARSGARTKVRIVGDGPERRVLEHAVSRMSADCPTLSVEFCGSSLDPWPQLAECDLIVGMGLVALEAAVRGHNVLCASSDGIGGRLSVASYPKLFETNFTGRSIEPLSVEALVRALIDSIATGPDLRLGPFVMTRHGDEAIDQWISLWNAVLWHQ